MKLKLFKLKLLFIFSLIASCYELDCDEELKKMENLSYNIIIDKKYIKDHRRYIEGHDTLGAKHKFEYYGFFDLKELSDIGDKFLKDSGDITFTLIKPNKIHKFAWDCKSSGTLISTVTIKE